MADTTVESIFASNIIIDASFVSTSGSASSIDLTAALAVPAADAAAAQADATQALADAATAQATADAAVAKADVQQFTVNNVDLIDTASGTTYTFIAEFGGTLVRASFVLDGATTAVDACSVAIDITGAACTLAAPLSAPAVSAAGFAVSTTITAPTGVFVQGDKIRITTTSLNTEPTFAGVSLGYTRT